MTHFPKWNLLLEANADTTYLIRINERKSASFQVDNVWQRLIELVENVDGRQRRTKIPSIERERERESRRGYHHNQSVKSFIVSLSLSLSQSPCSYQHFYDSQLNGIRLTVQSFFSRLSPYFSTYFYIQKIFVLFFILIHSPFIYLLESFYLIVRK